MKTLKKCLAMFLAILTLFSICSLSTTVFAAEYTEQKARTEYFDSALSGYLKNIVDTEDAVSISEKERVDQAVEEVKNSIASTSSTFSLRTASVQGTEETETAKEVTEELDIDHTRLTLELEDGENVAYLFSEPVSYLDEDGNIVYKDTDIISVTESSLLSDGYLYENADNNYKVYFGEDSSVGILLCSDKGSKISLIPNGANIVPGYVSSKKVDEIQTPVFEYDGVYGVNSLLRYTPQLNGCKEEIILSAYGGVSQFSFTLLTGDCIAAINSEGKIEIIDKNKNILDTIAEPYAYDAVGAIDETSEHYSECSYELTLVEDGVYTLTLVVPEEYLLSDSTVYPVTIDPTTSSIYQSRDIPVYSKYPTSTFSGNETNCFGKSNDYGYGRVYTYFAVPSDIKNYATINSAYIWMRETTGRTDTIRVRPYIVTSDWTNSTTWNTKASYGDYTCAFRLINSASEDGKGVYWYKFDIKSAVKAWTSGTKNRGLAFISRTEIIDGTYVWRAFASRENSTSSYRPYVVINYTNDTTAPTVKSVTNPGKDVWKNTDIIVTATAEDAASGLATKGYLFDGGSTWQAPNSKKYSSEGTYTVSVKAKDKAGNISAAKSGGTVKIDKTAPQNVKVNNPADGVWKNTDVTVKITATDNLSGVASYSFDNGSNWQPSNSKTYSSNGTYTITAKAKDNATNVSSAVSGGTVKIDKTAPAVSKPTKYPDTEWSNTNVTVTNNATDALSGIPTSGYSFDGGSTWQTKTKTYSTEGTYTVTPKAKDNAGNIGTGTAITVKIDKTAPTATVTGTVSGSNVSATINASDALSGLHATPYSFNGGTTWVTGKTATLSANTTHTIKVRDKAGNIRTITYNPKAGTVTASPSLDIWTNGTVTLTASGTNISQYNFDSGSWGTVKSKSYSANTTAKVGFKDSSGNITYINVPITNIDAENPVIAAVNVTPEGGWAKGEIKVIVDAEDDLSGISQYSFDGGVTWQDEDTVTYTDNVPKSVNVVVKDKAGNETSWNETIALPKYDNGIPASPDLYEQDGLVYISSRSFDFNEETDSPEHIEYKIENGEWTEYDGEPINIVRTYGATVYARVRDDAENISPIAEIELENNLGEYTASYTDIALGEGLFPVEFGRIYTSTNGWFFTFDANIDEIDENAYVFTDFYGEKQYFIKNSEGKYLSVDEEELTVNADSYVLTYGDMTCTFDLLDGKINRIVTDYLDTAYTWNDNGTLTITGGATVTFTDGKPTEITITRTDSKGNEQIKVVKYEWSDDGNLTKFFDAAYSPNDTESDSIHNYAYTNGLLTTNDTETITYYGNRVSMISQPNGAFVKYIYKDKKAEEDSDETVKAVIVSDSKGVTDTIPYSDGVYISSTLDSYSDNASYDSSDTGFKKILDATQDERNIDAELVYVVESEPQSEEQGTGEPSTGGELESDGEPATDNEAEGEINGEENDAEQGEDNNAPSAPELPLYEAINENTYVFYDYDEQNRVATELTVLKSRIADITTATFEDAEKVVKAETVYVYASETDNTITDKYVFTYTDDVKLQTEELYQPINNVLFCVSKFTYDSNENIVLEQYFRPGTENETPIEYENCTRVYEGENLLSETQQTLVDGELTTTKKLLYEYYEGGNIKTETQQTLVDGVLTTTKKLSYEYYEDGNIKTEIQEILVDGVLTTTKKLSYEYDIGDQLTSYTVEEYTMGDLRLVSSESYNYNNFGNLEKEIIEEYTYVLNSDTSKYDRVPNTIEKIYAYDIWNQQINITVKKTGEADSTTVITYDDLGNISTVTEDGVAVAYTYSNGNVSTITETKELQQDNGTKVTKTVTSVYGYTDGNLVSRTNTTEVDEVVTETTGASYGYDEYGNLTYHEFNGYAFTYNTLGSILTAKAAVKVDENGEKTNAGIHIVSYTYSNDIKQDVLNSTFGNDQIIAYEYNPDGEITAIKLCTDAEPKYEYKYSSEEQKASEDEATTEEEDTLTANLEGEWVKINDKVSGLFKVIQENKTSVYDSANNFVYSVETSSKDADNADSFDGTITTIGENVYTLVAEENEDVFKTNNNVDFSKKYVYNEEESELERTLTSNVFFTDYGYGDNGVTVLENVFEKNDNGEITEGYVFNYGYENENISSETLSVKSKSEDSSSDGHTESVSYEYDDNDQLTKATSGTTEWAYEYDSRGNIISKTIKNISTDNTVTSTYGYDSEWQDRLISYNGQEIKYALDDGTTDNSNPLVYRGNALTWTMGRQLASFGSNTYTYNEEGIRTSKTVNGVKTTFMLDGYNIIEQTDGTTTLHFFYDSNGEVIGFRYNGNDYFYVKNAMSDIIAITDSNKNIVAEYRYDPWGKVLGEENLTVIGSLNPFRYRSYYYDSDIKMYYLQSRYYDAEVGRFINCDDVNYIGVTESEVSYNPFAYCENNSVNCCDFLGLAKTHSTLSKNASISTIIKKAKSVFLNSSVFKMYYIINRFRIKGRWVTDRIPAYIFEYFSLNQENLKLRYKVIDVRSKVIHVTGFFGIRTVNEWREYILQKHESLLLKLRDKIVKNVFGMDDQDFDAFSYALGSVDGALKFMEYYSYVETILDMVQTLIKDKEDRYILSIIKKYSDKKTVMILFEARYYQYDWAFNTKRNWYLYKHNVSKYTY